jgi:hypothetical protein
MSVQRAAQSGPDSTPIPTSDVRPALSAKDALALALAEMDLEASREAARLYGDDELLELEAMAAGTHPKQRRLDARAIAETSREAADALAQIRATLRA